MKRLAKLALLTTLGMTLAGVGAYAQSEPTDQPTGGPPPGAPKFGQVLKGILEKYDVNKDGILDKEEMAALTKDIAEGKIQPPPPPNGPGPRNPGGPGGQGGPGFGQPPTAKEILQKFDVDKDGKLDEAELAAFLKDMRQHRPGPGGGRGPHGPPPGDAPPPE